MTSSPGPAGTFAGAGPVHPLDPLTAGEIRQAAAILRRSLVLHQVGSVTPGGCARSRTGSRSPRCSSRTGTRPPIPPADRVRHRAEVIGHTLWVTSYREDERWPCGDFPNLSQQDAGLPAWTARNRSIESTDRCRHYIEGIRAQFHS